MENNTKKTIISCKHCQKKIQFALPEKQGVFRVKCPLCGGDNNVRLAPKEIKLQQPPVGQTVNQQESAKLVIACPDCSAKLRFDASPDGLRSLLCPKCKAQLEVEVNEGQVASVHKKGTKPLTPDLVQSSIGKLTVVRWGGMFGKIGSKSYDLHMGVNTVGRRDGDLPSDIELDGDNTISRRSISIEVTGDMTKGFLFKMSVLRAANPVLHNNRQLIEGESIYLNYGDSLCLGKTTLVFNKK